MELRRSSRARRLAARSFPLAIGFALIVSLILPMALAQSQGQFAPPHSDAGVDTDGNGLFDLLELTINISVTVPGNFYLSVNLFDGSNTSFITSDFLFLSLSGPSSVVVDLYGPDIRRSGFDGPYLANLYLYDDGFSLDDYDQHTTAAYLATDFDDIPLRFYPPHTDSGVDTDGNGLFDWLRVNAVVNVSETGTYILQGDLRDSFGFGIDYESVTIFLNPGINTVALDFVGWRIYANGVDGPYTAYLSAFDSSYRYLDSSVHTTQAYAYTDFEAPPLRFAPPHSDSGLDTDGDGLNDFLRVNATVNVTSAGTYNIQGNLRDSFGSYIGFSAVTVFVNPGIQVVALDFSSWPIYSNGVDGPYTVDLYAYDASFALLDFDNHTTRAYAYTDFEPPPLTFAPPHSDAGVDTDGDGLYNVLRINVSVDVTQAGTYNIDGTLYDAFFRYIDSSFTTVTLAVGVQTVPLDFAGWRIRQNGADGMYTAFLSARDASFAFLDSDTYITQTYQALQFDTPPAALAPPHSDTGIDSDGDGLYNAIGVNVSVNVDEAGTYLVSANLYDSTFSYGLGFASSSVDLGTGLQTVPLEFSTIPMVASAVDGPYVAWITLYTSDFDSLGTDVHTTAAYTVSQFDPLPARFNPPHSDRGVDRDTPPDGSYNALEVDVGLNVTESGVYAVIGNLWDSTVSSFITTDIWFGALSPGNRVIPLFFSGVDIRSSGIDGPYYAAFTLLAIFDGNAFAVAFDSYTTAAYPATDFQAVTPATLTGTVRDAGTDTGIAFASVSAYDYRNGKAVSTGTDASGNYVLDLYDGDWYVAYDGPAYQAELQRVTVSGPTTNDAALGPTRPQRGEVDLTFATWDTANVVGTRTIESDNATFRLFIDWNLGNQDGMLDQPEFDAFLAFVGGGLPTLPSTSQDVFRVDGTAYDLVPGSTSFRFVNVTGPVDSTIPISAEIAGSYVASAPIPGASVHILEVQVDYDVPQFTNRYRIALPDPYVLSNFTASPAVTVSGLGTGTVTVDPGPDPNPGDGIASEWVSLEATYRDTTRPTIGGTTASPDPVEAGDPVLFSADVTDNDAVGSVSVEVRDSSGTPLVNLTMAFNPTSGTYEASRSFTTVGTLSYTVWASDPSGNAASATGTVVIEDTKPPTLSGTADTPDPLELGGTTTISTQASDVVGIASVKVEVRDPNGVLVGNFTMTSSGGSGYSYAFTPSGTGAYTYKVTALDAAGNAAVTVGSFQVLDTAPPSANAGPDQTVLEGATVTFDGIASSDLGGIASYSWTFSDGGAITLTGPSPTHAFNMPGTYTVTLTVTDASGNIDTDTVVIAVTATTGTVQGTVTNPAGQPIAGAMVRLLSGTTEVATTTTNADGQFTFAKVPQGSYTIRVEAAGFETKTQAADVVAAQTVTASIQLVAATQGVAGLGLDVWALILVAVLAVAVLALVWMRRRRRRPKAPETAPPAEAKLPDEEL